MTTDELLDEAVEEIRQAKQKLAAADADVARLKRILKSLLQATKITTRWRE